MPIYSAVVAYDQHHAIGKNNQLLWRLPDDLKHFKALTLNKPLVMGRKTFESIGKPLPNRRNIVLTRDQTLTIAGCEMVHSIPALQKLVENEPEVMVGGGAEIYQLLMPLTTRIYATEVQGVFEADAFFQQLDKTQWQEVSRERHAIDEKHAYAFDFLTLIKRVS